MFIHAVFHRPHTKPCSICSIFETAETRQWLVEQNVSTCRYNGMESSTNMVILDIKMLSGFVPDPQSLQSVSCCFFPSRKYSSSIVHVNCWCCSDVVIVPNIIFFTAQRCFASESGWSEGRPCHCLLGGGKKTFTFTGDQQCRHRLRLVLLLQQLPQNIPIFHTLALIQEIPVQNLKPAIVKIYDYYQPSKSDALPCHPSITFLRNIDIKIVEKIQLDYLNVLIDTVAHEWMKLYIEGWFCRLKDDKDPDDVLFCWTLTLTFFSGDQAETEYVFSCASGSSLFLYTQTMWHLSRCIYKQDN